MITRKDLLESIDEKIERLSHNLEKSKIADYVFFLEHPRKLLFTNFMAGLARGFGAAIGFTIISALVLYLLRTVVMLNLPVIGDFISEIVDIVQNNLNDSKRKVGV